MSKVPVKTHRTRVKMSLITALFIITATLAVFPQTHVVSQEFLDDSRRAFVELRAERAVAKAQEAEIAAKNELIAAQKDRIDALMSQIEVLKDQNRDLSKLKCDKTTFLFHLVTIKRCK